MEVEHVAGERLAAGRAAQEQHDLAVGEGLLVEVVVEDDDVAALVAEALAHGAARVARGYCMDASSIADALTTIVYFIASSCSRRRTMSTTVTASTHRDVDADDLVEVVRITAAGRLLRQDGVREQGGLAGLVADDQLTLAATDRDHGVDRLDPVCIGSSTG